MKAMMMAMTVAAAMLALGEEAKPKPTVEKTMTVRRCQYVDAHGIQCTSDVSSGYTHCFMHRGAMKSVGETASETGEAIGNAASTTWDCTKNAANSVRVGVVQLFGGKDDDGKESSGEKPAEKPAAQPGEAKK